VGELLLELLSEEIPARMQRRAIDEFAGLVRDKLAAAEIPAQNLRGYVTPRRLTLIADGIPGQQPDRSEERRGPRVGAPLQAIEGFLRAVGLGTIDACEIRDTGRGEFYFAIIQRPGRPAAEILRELLRAAIGELPWPTSMRYPASSLRWVRPLVSVVALFDGAVLPLALDQIPVGRTTRGHRFLSDGEIAVENAQDYRDKLEAAYVILDHDRRKGVIAADLDRLAKAQGLTVKPDPALLDEVAGLVEFPVVLMGAIDEASMELPPEVLATAMRTHQKYFSCLNADGSPAPRFLFVANNLTPDDGETITAGNERVLRARLADARFFWEQDRKVRLADRDDGIRARLLYEGLGSLYDKVDRMAGLIYRGLGTTVGAHTNLAFRAARLSKSDLSTGMVGEFPELQGVMGRYYALNDGEDPLVADAIAEHYKPLGPHDTCPTKRESVAVALADKIDSLVVFFAIGEKPTGSRDPFALRRAALGVIRLVLENNLRVSLGELFSDAWMGAVNISGSDPTDELLEFVLDRLKVHLRGQGVRHDLIAAAFVQSRGIPQVKHFEDDLLRLIARVRALESFLATDDGANLLVAYRRAANILVIEERKDGRRYDDRAPDLAPGMLRLREEKQLENKLRTMFSTRDAWSRDFTATMAALAELRQPIDEFFDKVTVNTDEKVKIAGKERSLRENRLRLLSTIRAAMNQVADFSQIEG
jgi:glycyl-tRNA synthetase beta chain